MQYYFRTKLDFFEKYIYTFYLNHSFFEGANYWKKILSIWNKSQETCSSKHDIVFRHTVPIVVFGLDLTFKAKPFNRTVSPWTHQRPPLTNPLINKTKTHFLKATPFRFIYEYINFIKRKQYFLRTYIDCSEFPPVDIIHSWDIQIGTVV